jgi:hypothetical protein
MSAQFVAAKAQGSSESPKAPVLIPIPPESKAALDAQFGENAPEGLTAESLAASEALIRGEIIPGSAPAPTKEGVVAAEPGSVPQETPAPPEPAPEAVPAVVAPAVEPEIPPAEIVPPTEPEKAKTDEPASPEPTPPTEPEKDQIRPRLRKDAFASEQDWKIAQKAADFMREGMLPAKAEAAARDALGIQSEVTTTPTPAVPEVLPEVQTLQSLQTQLEAKEAARDAALLAYQNEDVVVLNKEIRELSRKTVQAERAAEQAESRNTSWQASVSRAQTEFPESNQPGHPLHKAIAGAYATMADDDPLRTDPDGPLKVAAREAAELKVPLKPKSQRTAPAATTPASVPAIPTGKPPPKVSPVSGSRSTVVPTTTPEQDLDKKLAGMLGPQNADMLRGI